MFWEIASQYQPPAPSTKAQAPAAVICVQLEQMWNQVLRVKTSCYASLQTSAAGVVCARLEQTCIEMLPPTRMCLILRNIL